MSVDVAHRALDYALKQGVKFCVVRIQERVYERIEVDRGALKEYSYTHVRGLGVAVYVHGGYGYAYTSKFDIDSIHKTVEKAIASARAIATHITGFRKLTPAYGKHSFKVEYRINPFDVPAEEKIALILKLNRESMNRQGIVSATTRMGIEHERKLIVTSEDSEISIEVMMAGISHLSIARDGAIAERVYDHKSSVGGYEFIERTDWHAFISEVDTLAIEASRASTPTAGVYTAVIDNRLIGLLLHEAFGHASEGDTVLTGSSVLRGKLGQSVASELVTVIDEGLVNGGYPVPFDDEGNPKRKTVVVERGILRNFLTSSIVAEKLNLQLTGNARAQSFNYEPLVRQTNYYLEPRDWRVEELFEDISNGIYLKGRGALGGQVDPSVGTFTFSVGPSYIIERGEPRKLVRGVIVSGYILETLREIDAVARDLSIFTNVFGGCGKGGQIVRVGYGGPHVRVRRIVVGGA